MANSVRDYVAGIPEDECRMIHKEGIAWEDCGRLPEGYLRSHTEIMLEKHDITTGIFIIWMQQVLHEVWRRFALDAMGAEPEPAIGA